VTFFCHCYGTHSDSGIVVKPIDAKSLSTVGVVLPLFCNHMRMFCMYGVVTMFSFSANCWVSNVGINGFVCCYKQLALWHFAVQNLGKSVCGELSESRKFLLTLDIINAITKDLGFDLVRLYTNNDEQWKATTHGVRVEVFDSHK